MCNETRRTWQRKVQSAVLSLAVSLLFASISAQASVDLADKPLFLTASVDPNIMFVLDDSGSMQWEHMPDHTMFFTVYVFPRPANLYGGSVYANQVPDFNDANLHNVFSRSPENNAVFYNPMLTYTPWLDGNADPFLPGGDVDPTDAPYNPADLTRGTLDLTISQTQSARWFRNITNTTQTSAWWTCGPPCNQTFWPITFYRYIGTGNRTDTANYIKYQIRGDDGFTQDLNGGGETAVSNFVWTDGSTTITRTVLEERQNFANWFSYYRSRILASRAGIGRAFASQSENMRVGFGTINKGLSTIDGQADTRTIIRGVRPFTGTDRDGFFDELYNWTLDTSGTPLRRSLDAAGRYFERTDNAGPWGDNPGSSVSGDHLTCRQSYTILMTDGFWNGSTPAGIGNTDNTDGPLISDPEGNSYQYVASDPYRDGWSDTLADVAMHYWKRDLRPALDNEVPTSVENEAFWQHMVTFGVGLGVEGTINPNDAWNAVATSSPMTWPNPFASDPAKLDDLLHAGVNSRGGFFSAADPDTFATELTDVLVDIVARVEASGTAAATSSAVLQTDTLLYAAKFRSTDWSGTVEAREVDPNDGTPGAVLWDAEQKMHAMTPASRKIFTLKDDGTKIPLLWSSLGTSQQDALDEHPSAAPPTADGEDRLNWLRGTEHADLRDRSGGGIIRRIGDLVNSDPQFMFKRDFGYSLLDGTQGTAYKTFRSTSDYESRPDVLFVASNGGMLHAFHAGTPFIEDPPDSDVWVVDPAGGSELFAYVPSELLLPGTSGTHAQINELMDPSYDHRYYVDGTAVVTDAYLGGWKTVVVGSMGAGGRTVFALDVTDPENFAAANVLWEFGYADTDCVPGVTACREVGYGITQPSVARLSGGDWVAIFGNGFNSANHKAQLFVVNLDDGTLRAVIDTGVGEAATPNGLGPAVATDWPNSDLNAGRAYAADLQGNIWRFSLTASTAQRLFSATDASATAQPITARPTLAARPGNTGQIIVAFGTGSFFRTNDDDMTSPQVQSLYGIFDSASGLVDTNRSQLTEQVITTNSAAVTVGTETYPAGSLRFVSSNAVGSFGWVLDLPASGERVISEATFPSGTPQQRVRFTTLIPDPDPCGSGRDGFIMDFALASGGSPSGSVFDLSGDGVVDAGDEVGGAVVIGIGGTTGERITVIRNADSSLDHLYDGSGQQLLDSLNEAGPIGRQSWRQLR